MSEAVEEMFADGEVVNVSKLHKTLSERGYDGKAYTVRNILRNSLKLTW